MGLLPASIVHDDVETPQPANGFRHQVLAKSLVAKVTWYGHAYAPSACDQVNHLGRIRLLGGR